MGVMKGGGREPEAPPVTAHCSWAKPELLSVRRHGAPATRWLGPELRAQAASTHRAQPCPRRAANLETKSLTYTHRDALPTRRRRRSCYHRPTGGWSCASHASRSSHARPQSSRLRAPTGQAGKRRPGELGAAR